MDAALEDDELGDSMVLDKTYRSPDVVQDVIVLKDLIDQLQLAHHALTIEVAKERQARLEFERKVLNLQEPCDEKFATPSGAINIIERASLPPLLEVSTELSSQASTSLRDISDMSVDACREKQATTTVRFSEDLRGASKVGFTSVAQHEYVGGLPDNRVSDCLAPSPRMIARAQSPNNVMSFPEAPQTGRPSMPAWMSPSIIGSSRGSNMDSTNASTVHASEEASVGLASTVEVDLGITEKQIQYAIQHANTRVHPQRSVFRARGTPPRGSPRAMSPANNGDQGRQVTVEISKKLRSMEVRWQKMQEETSSLRSQLQDLGR